MSRLINLPGKIIEGLGIAWLHDYEVRYLPEEGYIFKRHMCSTVILGCDTRVRSDTYSPLVSIAERSKELVVVTTGHEAAERVDKWHKAYT